MSKLAVLVAKKVMNAPTVEDLDAALKVVSGPYIVPWHVSTDGHPSVWKWIPFGADDRKCERWSPDTNASDAMEVFDKFTDALLEKAGDGYEVTINAWAQGDNKNKCIAICLAALRAVGMTDAEIGEALR